MGGVLARPKIRSLLRTIRDNAHDLEAVDNAEHQLLALLLHDDNKRRFVDENGVPVVLDRWPSGSAIGILRLLCAHKPSCRMLVTNHGLLERLASFVHQAVACAEARDCAILIRRQGLDDVERNAMLRNTLNYILSAVDESKRAAARRRWQFAMTAVRAMVRWRDTKPSPVAKHALSGTFGVTASKTTPVVADSAPLIVKTYVPSPPSPPSLPSPPSPPPLPLPAVTEPSIPIEARFVIKQELSMGDRNTVLGGETQGFFKQAVVIKIFQRASHAQSHNETNQLRRLSDFSGFEQFVVKAKDFCDNIVYKNQVCSVLTMEPGKKNLQETVKQLRPAKISEYVVPTMKNIVESLHFLHSHAHLVHGDLRLENVVNFNDGFPHWKLIDFEFSCGIHDMMTVQCDPEYCPPEVAVRLLNHDPTFCATTAFDIYCFGVLWMKFLMNGEVLAEFSDLNKDKTQILQKICHSNFSFDRTLQQCNASRPMKSLIRACTNRDPRLRPAAKDIMTHYVIRGFSTTLMKITTENKLIADQFNTMQEFLRELLEQNNRMIAQVDKLLLPCLWVLVPWDASKSPDKELRMVCDAAFDDPLGEPRSVCCRCPEHHRIRVRTAHEFIQNKAFPVLRGSAVILKIADLAGEIMNVKVSDTLKRTDVVQSTQVILSQATDKNDIVERTLSAVQAMAEAERSADVDQKDKRIVAKVLYENSQALREWFQAADKQQLMHEILQAVDSNTNWTEMKVVGGLEKICDRDGNIRWVCANHAQHLATSAASAF